MFSLKKSPFLLTFETSSWILTSNRLFWPELIYWDISFVLKCLPVVFDLLFLCSLIIFLLQIFSHFSYPFFSSSGDQIVSLFKYSPPPFSLARGRVWPGLPVIFLLGLSPIVVLPSPNFFCLLNALIQLVEDTQASQLVQNGPKIFCYFSSSTPWIHSSHC